VRNFSLSYFIYNDKQQNEINLIYISRIKTFLHHIQRVQ
jgi:hypothetical protein